jgi:glycosyltransferase involved in cell wall biosynthesis
MVTIVFVHLLNDFSGSPMVLKETIASAQNNEIDSQLYIGSGSTGILSDCNIKKNYYWYRRTPYKLLTLITYTLSQFSLFFSLFTNKKIPGNAIIFVNTLLPFGAALYGKITKRKVIYHIHEISITPKPLKWFLTYVCKHTSKLNLYVSDAHRTALPIIGIPSKQIYNALTEEFSRSAANFNYQQKPNNQFNVLMIASLRDYKGVPEFFYLAKSMISYPDICFKLVVNDDQPAIDNYCQNKKLTPNLTIYPRTNDTKFFYKNSSLVLNLSRVDQWQETFGMTILEAITYGIPVITPPIGGPTEIIRDSKEGFYIDSRDHHKLRETVLSLYQNETLCLELSENARKRSTAFSNLAFSDAITSIIKQVHESN